MCTYTEYAEIPNTFSEYPKLISLNKYSSEDLFEVLNVRNLFSLSGKSIDISQISYNERKFRKKFWESFEKYGISLVDIIFVVYGTENNFNDTDFKQKYEDLSFLSSYDRDLVFKVLNEFKDNIDISNEKYDKFSSKQKEIYHKIFHLIHNYNYQIVLDFLSYLLIKRQLLKKN